MDYNYPTHLSDEQLQAVLRKVVDNMNTLRGLYAKYYKENDEEKILATKKLIDVHSLAIEKFLLAHPQDLEQ